MSLSYFAYGSNLSVRRLQQRVPSASFVCTACLSKHQLRFHKRNRDGSAKADCYASGIGSQHVWGAVFSIDADERILLDRAEGLGAGYEAKVVSVEGKNGVLVEAFTYVATDIVDGWLPYTWYKQHVVIGAKEVCLPMEYLQVISRIEAKVDPDESRDQRELSIYFPL